MAKRKRKSPKVVKRSRKSITVEVNGKRITIPKKKLPVTVKPVKRRTGRFVSKSRDAKRKALPPGWRISRSGRVYYEGRRNRSDRKRL